MPVGTQAASGSRPRSEVLLGALLFALGVPFGKLLLRGLPPLAIAGGVYLAAGLACAAWLAFRIRPRGEGRALRGREWAYLALAIVLGGAIAPFALYSGLRELNGYATGLLLNCEAVFTIALGVAFASERVGRRGAGGIALVLAGAVALSAEAGGAGSAVTARGAMLVVLACLCWALDNFITQRISLSDARLIVALKGIVGGLVNLGLAGLVGQLGRWTAADAIGVALLGCLSYGLSIVLFVRGLRALGVALTGALFATAPGMAAILSWLLLREPLTALAVGALVGMTAGALLLATDVHAHVHSHGTYEHSHPHAHDMEHRHRH